MSTSNLTDDESARSDYITSLLRLMKLEFVFLAPWGGLPDEPFLPAFRRRKRGVGWGKSLFGASRVHDLGKALRGRCHISR